MPFDFPFLPIVSFQAMRFAGKEPFPTIYVDGKEEGKVGKLSLLFQNVQCLTQLRAPCVCCHL